MRKNIINIENMENIYDSVFYNLPTGIAHACSHSNYHPGNINKFQKPVDY